MRRASWTGSWTGRGRAASCECWVMDPCCDVYCCLTWWCCGCFNACKMFSWSLDQPCALVNHCLPITFLPMCGFFRFAVREKLGISAGGPLQGLIGDFLCGCCCGYCACCQSIRGSQIAGG
eukprot:TRINITY_DN208_c0_g2_i1.p2 TRINITY_DN208_c0_g2~~TRINITY_DN208_c0_g2_i1.p2  ORF type:complete len:121 (+),score=4.59 TRINITY_DN208_c0_g2_i1:72-434(+)